MINYYLELELDSTMGTTELEEALRQLNRKWRQRTNAPSMEARQEAERKVQLINEAKGILLDTQRRALYDDELAHSRIEPAPSPKPEHNFDEDAVEEQLRAWEEAGKYREIIKLITQVYNSGLRNHEFCWSAGNACIEEDDLRNAVIWYNRSIEIEPDNPASVGRLAFIAEYQEDYESLKGYLDWLVEHQYEDTSWIASMRVKYYMKIDQEPMANSVIQQYLKKNPRDIKFKQDAQGYYFDLIAELSVSDECMKDDVPTVQRMLEYARRADTLYPCTRSREKIEIIERELNRIVQPEVKIERKGFFSRFLG